MMMTGVDIHGLQNTLHQDVSAFSDTSQTVPSPPNIGWSFWGGSLIATLAWLYSLVDAAVLSGRRKS